ncbi:MAG TPA: hypothetical protein VHS34_17660 [Terriglobales bacterium]|nr:hypothetical protein [Terriglobales bacterium]
MAVFPRCRELYRTGRRAVILTALGLMLAQMVPAQSAGHKGPPKGPRALGLLQLSASGKARLIPVTILYDGEFYDASAYKAAPVPMALESGTVYEAVRTGVSQGLFTVSSALQGNNTWIGEGTWQTASERTAAAAASAKRKEARSKPAPEPVEGPPVLRRASSKPAAPPPAPPDAPSPAPTASSAAPSTPAASAPGAPAESSTPAPVASEEDPDRPILKRGAPSPAEMKKPSQTVSAAGKKDTHKPSTAAPPAPGSVQLIPAISDANGPDFRPYAYSLKPDEEDKLRKKILVLAADEVRARAEQLAKEAAEAQPAKRPATRPRAQVKPPQPSFEGVQLRVFDLSNSNEATLVLTAKARMPARPGAPNADLQYLVTVVARNDIYGDLHKAFASITDTQHLDVLPRMEFIDAVDADGDGRGELLFREISDAGNAFVLYRVIGDQLWPLFQGTPGQ